MNYTELRIGDWVSFPNPTTTKKTAKYSRVTTIAETNCRVESEGYFLVSLGYIDPIPLTEDILKKNGWSEELQENEWRKPYPCNIILSAYERKNDKTLWWCVEVGTYSDRVNVHDIRYVHELQHILWALGLDDKMEV